MACARKILTAIYYILKKERRVLLWNEILTTLQEKEGSWRSITLQTFFFLLFLLWLHVFCLFLVDGHCSIVFLESP
jgi:hypothetical protein